MLGSRIWAFPDGDLPPAGDKEPYGHEALMIINLNKKTATINAKVYFEDCAPFDDITIEVEAERVICLRLDKPIGKQGYQIPQGQYALIIESDVPVVAHFGRLDVRQPNLSYYSIPGYVLG